jgi:hypothetical protein
MKIRMLLALALVVLAVSGCIVEPGGGYHGHDHGGEYGRGVWRG